MEGGVGDRGGWGLGGEELENFLVRYARQGGAYSTHCTRCAFSLLAERAGACRPRAVQCSGMVRGGGAGGAGWVDDRLLPRKVLDLNRAARGVERVRGWHDVVQDVAPSQICRARS